MSKLANPVSYLTEDTSEESTISLEYKKFTVKYKLPNSNKVLSKTYSAYSLSQAQVMLSSNITDSILL